MEEGNNESNVLCAYHHVFNHAFFVPGGAFQCPDGDPVYYIRHRGQRLFAGDKHHAPLFGESVAPSADKQEITLSGQKSFIVTYYNPVSYGIFTIAII